MAGLKVENKFAGIDGPCGMYKYDRPGAREVATATDALAQMSGLRTFTVGGNEVSQGMRELIEIGREITAKMTPDSF